MALGSKIGRHRAAQRFIGYFLPTHWLPESATPLHPSKRRIHTPQSVEITAQTLARLMADLFPKDRLLEFRDEEGFDGKRLVWDGQLTETGLYYCNFALYSGDGDLWGDMDNFEAAYLQPAAMSLVRSACRDRDDMNPVLFQRPPKEYLPLHTMHTYTAVYNGVCVRATEYLNDHEPTILIDTVSGVKGKAAQLYQV